MKSNSLELKVFWVKARKLFENVLRISFAWE